MFGGPAQNLTAHERLLTFDPGIFLFVPQCRHRSSLRSLADGIRLDEGRNTLRPISTIAGVPEETH